MRKDVFKGDYVLLTTVGLYWSEVTNLREYDTHDTTSGTLLFYTTIERHSLILIDIKLIWFIVHIINQQLYFFDKSGYLISASSFFFVRLTLQKGSFRFFQF